ncbi:MAG TPA: twin-arginine translocase subunit TatC [Streptosporangiaceae bacterium]|nr:twin-arginine translocase subunit TatC [Streptosporangiaceae bacterium]
MSAAPDSSAPAHGRHLGVRAGKRDNPEARMPLMEHIRELRNRLIKGILGLAVGMVAGWYLFHPAWNFIIGPFCHLSLQGHVGCGGANGHPLVVTGIFDPFFVRLKVAFVVGLVISSPVWFYQLWAFIAPGLYAREKRWTWAFVGSAVPLFGLGALFAYLAMSRGLRFLLGLTPADVRPLITIDTYFGYATAMLLIFGLAFELPLVLVMLNLAGVLSHEFFRKWRRVMLFAVFVFAGAATPSPDPFSMLLLAIPCVVLVEVAEVLIWLNSRRRTRLQEAETASLLAGDDIVGFDQDTMDADRPG